MTRLILVLTLLALILVTVLPVSPALGRLYTATPTWEARSNRQTILWYDDMEGDLSDYTTVDLSAEAVAHFRVSRYKAFAGEYSWWCGTFSFDANGGYGNAWDDRLDLPELDLSGATYPILTFAYRHDSEPEFDFTYVQAESGGVYVSLNHGYDGVGGWYDLGAFGFVLTAYDNPLRARFRFVSDGAWSDEDGLYLSNGGSFMCDNIRVFDYVGGYTYFYDDAESGGLCTPSLPPSAGDYWHPIVRKCPAYTDPTSWWCGDDADTGFVPPNLNDALFSPLIDIRDSAACTAWFAMHFAMPTVDNDYVAMWVTATGSEYYNIGGWWGDFGSCDGWGTNALNRGFDITQFNTPAEMRWGGFAWVMHTTNNGCGPARAGDAGAMIDDLMYGPAPCPAEQKSWGAIKAFFR